MTSAPTRIDPPREARLDVFGLLARFAPLLFLAILMAVFATLQPRFLSTINLLNVLRQVSISGLLAIGMTFVILTAGIDLSVGLAPGLLRDRRRDRVQGKRHGQFRRPGRRERGASLGKRRCSSPSS